MGAMSVDIAVGRAKGAGGQARPVRRGDGRRRRGDGGRGGRQEMTRYGTAEFLELLIERLSG
eukprot:COSAG05_NODE_5597_length_1133_cov_2.898453_1_plen_62_part_00